MNYVFIYVLPLKQVPYVSFHLKNSQWRKARIFRLFFIIFVYIHLYNSIYVIFCSFLSIRYYFKSIHHYISYIYKCFICIITIYIGYILKVIIRLKSTVKILRFRQVFVLLYIVLKEDGISWAMFFHVSQNHKFKDEIVIITILNLLCCCWLQKLYQLITLGGSNITGN